MRRQLATQRGRHAVELGAVAPAVAGLAEVVGALEVEQFEGDRLSPARAELLAAQDRTAQRPARLGHGTVVQADARACLAHDLGSDPVSRDHGDLPFFHTLSLHHRRIAGFRCFYR